MTRVRATTLGDSPVDVELEITGGSGNTDDAEVHVAMFSEGKLTDMAWFKADDIRSAVLRATNPIFTRNPEGDDSE